MPRRGGQRHGQREPRGVRLVGDDRVLGQRRAPIALARLIAFSGARSAGGGGRPWAEDRLGAGGDPVGQCLERAVGVLVASARAVTAQPSGTRSLGLAGVGEERHRRPGPGQDQVSDAGQLGFGRLGQVGQPVDGGQPGAALQPGRERLGQQPRAGRGADPAGRAQPALGQAPSRRAAAGAGSRELSAAAAGVDRRRWRRRGAAAAERVRGARRPPSLQDTSAGRTRVAIWPGVCGARRGRASASGPGRGACRWCAPSRTPFGPAPRCRTAAGRRSGRGRWRARRR